MRVDETMQSLLNYGTPDFPFAFYQDKSDAFDGRDISWHWHNSFEFSYASVGGTVCEIDGKKIYLNAGDAIFINSSVLHCFMLQDASKLENILFEPEFIAPTGSRVYMSDVLPYLQSDLQYIVFRSENEMENQLICLIKQCCIDVDMQQENNTHLFIEVLSKVITLWSSFVVHCKIDSLAPSKSMISLTQNRVRKMLYYMYKNYGEKIGLSEIAAAANISQREALRCFSESINISPIQYLNDYRLRCAEQLLRKSLRTVSDIALETGYDNSGYFCKAFKKKYGLSPLQYRKKFALNF